MGMLLQFFLPLDRRDGIIHPQHLMVPRDDLPRSAGPAVVKEDEVLDQIQEPFLGQHAIQQGLCVHAPLVLLRRCASTRRNAPICS